jgi:hypothetical protein
MILKWILEKMWIRDAKWIHLAQCRYWWRALVNTFMNLRIP